MKKKPVRAQVMGRLMSEQRAKMYPKAGRRLSVAERQMMKGRKP